MSLVGRSGCTLALLATLVLPLTAQANPTTKPAAEPTIPQRSPHDWAVLVSNNEIHSINRDGPLLRYRIHTVDAKSDRVREVVECTGGSVSRLLSSGGKPLSAEQDRDELQRLEDLAKDPGDFAHHSKEDTTSRKLARDLVSLMPDAMIYTPVPGQTVTHDAKGDPLLVFDFAPNPNWHPPTTSSEALTGLRGRVWVNARAGYVERMDGEVFRPVNFGFGMVARIYPGGHLQLEQTDAADGRWIYSHFTAQLRIRALLLKTIDFNIDVNNSDFQPLPGQLSYQQAIQLLLH